MSVEFNGDDYFFATSALIVSPPFSVSVWFFPVSNEGVTPVSRVFIIYGTGSNRHECRLDASGPQTLSAVSATLTAATATTANAYNEDEWNHGLWTIDTSLRTVALNGGTAASNTTTRSPTVVNTGIGGPGITPMVGRLANLAIWDVDLSLDANYAAINRALSKGFSPYAVHPENLVAWFPFIDENPRDIVGSFALTIDGAPFKAPHPRLIPPRHTGKKILQGVNPVVGTASISATATLVGRTHTLAETSLLGTVAVAGSTRTLVETSIVGTATADATTQTLADGSLLGTAEADAITQILAGGSLTGTATIFGEGSVGAFTAAASIIAVITVAGAQSRILVPFPYQVRAGVVYESNDLPEPRDVRAGIMYGLEDAPLVGTLVLPDPSDVRCGVEYGAPDA